MAPRRILPLIVVAQFAGTSVWFVGNAVLGAWQHLWPEVDGAVGWLTSSVQLGFICGTLAYALSGISDRRPAHRVFCGSAIAAAAATAAALIAPQHFAWFVGTRFVTGFFLAGVYPVGMKLAASWFREGLGAAIGLLVGALVLGTAFPHLLGTAALDPATLTLVAAGLAAIAGLVVLVAVPEGPSTRRASSASFGDALSLFRIRGFRSAALGYFGHMWELYAFWAFVPFALTVARPGATATAISGWAFAVIAVGSIGCIVGGLASRRVGSARVAGIQLVGSGLCGIVSPWLLGSPSAGLALLVVWGILVVGDSPQFSAVAARSAPPDRIGTGLTLMNAIGFALTIPSIQLLTWMRDDIAGPWLLTLLVPGPIIGVLGLLAAWRDEASALRSSR